MASQRVGDELSPFLLKVPGLEEAAEKEEKEALRGSYGFVFKVTVGGVKNIAKKLHSAFIGHSRISPRERESIFSRFRNECIILSKLRHPNIVQFVGVHFGLKGLTLIMESLRSDLDDFFSDNPQVPLSLKLSMLRDVSYGLVYLHDERTPAIIHRDLTAKNILITDNCQAKIADLGMAKIVTLQEQLAQSHTQVPGQVFYMPPEALTEKAECTPKLDIFSFGHLALFVIIQDYPKVYDVTMTADIQKNGIFQRLKRQRSLDLVGGDHCLYPIITECLYDRPEQRPTTRDLNSRLIQLSTQHPVSARQVMPYMGEEMARMSEELKDLQKSLEMKTAEVQKLQEEKEQEIRKLQEEKISKYKNLIKSMRKQIQELESEKSVVQAQAEIYRADFVAERADRERAWGELDTARQKIKILTAATEATTTYKSEALATQSDDLKYQKKKFKSDNKKAHKSKEQLAVAKRTVLSLQDQIVGLRKEKKTLSKNLKKAEDQIKNQMKKSTKAIKRTHSTASLVTHQATKEEPFYEREHNANNEALLQEIDELKDDIEYQKDVIKSLRSLIKGEDDSSFTISEKSLASPHITDHPTKQNDFPYISSESSEPSREQPDRQFSSAEQMKTPIEGQPHASHSESYHGQGHSSHQGWHLTTEQHTCAPQSGVARQYEGFSRQPYDEIQQNCPEQFENNSQSSQFCPSGHPDQHSHDHYFLIGGLYQSSGQPDQYSQQHPSSRQYEQNSRHDWGEHPGPSHHPSEGSHERGGGPVRAGAQTHQPPQENIEDENNQNPEYLDIDFHQEQQTQQPMSAGGLGEREGPQNCFEGEMKPRSNPSVQQGVELDLSRLLLVELAWKEVQQQKESEKKLSVSQLPGRKHARTKWDYHLNIISPNSVVTSLSNHSLLATRSSLQT